MNKQTRAILNSQNLLVTDYINTQMQGSKQDVDIDEKLTYSLASQSFSKPLRITNHSDHIYVFKIKTNQKTVISMQLTHDFIQPHSEREISIKMAEKPNENTPLKLELNYAIPSEQDLQSKNSKMLSYPKQSIFKRIITIKRDDKAPEVKAVEVKQQKRHSPPKDYLAESINVSASSSRQQHHENKHPDTISKIESEPVSFIKVVSEEYKIADQSKTQPNYVQIVEKVQTVKPKEQKPKQIIEEQQIKIAKVEVKPQKESSEIRLQSPASQKIFVATTSHTMQISELEVLKQQTQRGIQELNQKIAKDKEQINQLRKQQQSEILTSIRSFPSITLLAILAFFLGSFSNWLCL